MEGYIFRILLSGLRQNIVSVLKKKNLHTSVVQSSTTLKEKENLDTNWESNIGLEIHAQITAKSKLFSNSAAIFGAPTNKEVSYFDAAFPGCLPVLNKCCVEAGVLTALALNCTIHKVSTFDRKHYFYPDLPAGYQITQHFHPLASNGYMKFIVSDHLQKTESYECCAFLKQLQLEEDTGRSFHVKGGKSLVDLNRAGIGLMELVFEPNLKNGLEAACLVKELILILKRLGTCTCEMEEGALRVDANISVHHRGEPLGVKTEVKNINSLRYISKAVDFEIERQIKVLEDGGIVANETRAFDYSTKKTVFMRDKETLQDYRFMPEPNLPPIKLCDNEDFASYENTDNVINIDALHKRLPLLPAAERDALITKYNVPYRIADKLVSIEGVKNIFEVIASGVKDTDIIFNFLLNNVQHQLNIRKITFADCPLAAERIGEIVELVVSKTISEATANDILEMFFNGDQRSAKEIVNKYNWTLIHDEKELETLCHKVMADRPKMVKKFKKSQKQRYMTSLLKGLNEICNNRASIKDAQAMFIKLMCDRRQIEAKVVPDELSDKEEKDV